MDDRKRKIPKVEGSGSDDDSVVFMRQSTARPHARRARYGQASDNQVAAHNHEQTVGDMMEGFREELAQTFNPRFELLEQHIVSINARLATAADSTNAVPTASGGDTTTNRHAPAPVPKEAPKAVALDHANLSLPPGSFASTPVLTNFGYKCLLRQFDFRDVTEWVSLAKLDNLANLRDCTLFCDPTFQQCYVDYVIRIGGTTKYISEDIGSPSGTDSDVQDLRIFEIEYLNLSLKDAHTYNEWSQRYDPPRYVYEIGQLFIRRRGKKTPKQELFSTDFNVVMDVTKPSKPLWLITRPGGSVGRARKDRDASSSSAFNQIGDSSVALLSRSIQEFSFTTAPYDQASSGKFAATHRLVLDSKLETSLGYHKTDISSIENAIKKTWLVESAQQP